MAVAVTAQQVAKFEDLFKKPTIEAMHAMDPYEFEQFIVYVFTCAGYRAEYVGDQHFPKGPGVDINLYTTQTGKIPTARVEVRRYALDNPLTLDDVRDFGGVLLFAGGIPGYLVTTGVFHPNARLAEEAANGKVCLIDGTQLLRYITYIKGSRVPDTEGRRRTASPTPPDWLANPSTPRHCDPRQTTVLTIANSKGGVAKTTSALNLGLALSQRGMRVLLVDLDGQASLTAGLPLPDPDAQMGKKLKRNAPLPPIPERQHYVSEFFAGAMSNFKGIVQPTRFENVWLLPANEDLHRMDSGGTARTEAELAFLRALHDPNLCVPDFLPHPGAFNWIIIDTPPAQSFYTRAALAAAHYVLIPVNVEAFAIRGIARVLDNATTMRALTGEGTKVLGCVITRWKSSAIANKEEAKLQDDVNSAGGRFFAVRIPFEDKIEQAHVATIGGGVKSLFGFSGSAAADRYRDLLSDLVRETQPYVHEPR